MQSDKKRFVFSPFGDIIPDMKNMNVHGHVAYIITTYSGDNFSANPFHIVDFLQRAIDAVSTLQLFIFSLFFIFFNVEQVGSNVYLLLLIDDYTYNQTLAAFDVSKPAVSVLTLHSRAGGSKG